MEIKKKTTLNFTNSLASTFFIYFMLIAFIPIGIIGVTEYYYGKKNILENSFQKLSSINFLLGESVKNYFSNVVKHLSSEQGSARLFISQINEFKNPSLTYKEYIETTTYKNIKQQFTIIFSNIANLYGYKDILLTDLNGNVIFSMNNSTMLTKNLFTNKTYKNSLLSVAVKDSIHNNVLKFVNDTSIQQNTQSNFFITPILDINKNIIGSLIIKIPSSSITNIFKQHEKFDKNLNSYIINQDGTILYSLDDKNLGSKILNIPDNILKEWAHHLNKKTHEPKKNDEHSYFSQALHFLSPLSHYNENHITQFVNHKNEHVLSTYYSLNTAIEPMVLVSEISEDIALKQVKSFRNRLIVIAIITIFMVVSVALFFTKRLIKPIGIITLWVKRVAHGNYNKVQVLPGNNEISNLSRSFADMTDKLNHITLDNQKKNWLQDGQVGLNKSIRGEQKLSELCKNIITYLATYTDIKTGAIYILNKNKTLQLMSTFAWTRQNQPKDYFTLGEGIVGQAGLDQKIMELNHIPHNYLQIESVFGKVDVKSIIAIPFIYEGKLKGVIEFGLLSNLNQEKKEFLKQSTEIIAIAINSAQYRSRVIQLLETTTQQSETLKSKQKELSHANSKLKERAHSLEMSQEKLTEQRQKLQKNNFQLEEKTKQLEQKAIEIEEKNKDIALSKKILENKAYELELASQYKSEFLANMSHELRTPLNSLLLLAKMLADNDEKNLTADQLESVNIIYNGGNELLTLINDILDLSKIEAGKMTIHIEKVDIKDIHRSLKMLFQPLANHRKLEFEINIQPGTYRYILSDQQRLMQVLKNFLSNAFKFTESGSVYIHIKNIQHQNKHKETTYLAFSVKDSGIGIPEEKQQLIFESFQQADGATTRKYGGTGLGLTISKEIASMLGGFINVKSKPGKGATFSIYLPLHTSCALDQKYLPPDSLFPEIIKSKDEIEEKKEIINNNNKGNGQHTKNKKKTIQRKENNNKKSELFDNKTILLVDDDIRNTFALSKKLQQIGLKIIIADNGQHALNQLQETKKIDLILMDIMMPIMDGYEAMKHIRNNNKFKKIPIIALTANAMHEDQQKCLTVGANEYLAKPIEIEKLISLLQKWLI